MIQAYSWTVPAGAKAGTYTMYVAVFNPAWSAKLAQKTTALTITAASATWRGADGSRAAGGQRHGPGRQGPHVNDRNLDGRNFLCLSVGRE